MSFPYDPTLPNPPDDPADDVAGMQTNSASISSLIAVDHSGFNAPTGGTHKQVTYSSNNIPSLPTTFPVSFTALPTSFGGSPTYAQQFFYSGTSTQSQNQYVLSGNGSVLLAGGIILKWGTVLNQTGTATVSFASAFPNNCFIVQTQPLNGSGPTSVNQYVTVASISTSTFTATCTQRVSKVSDTVTFYYFAIGN